MCSGSLAFSYFLFPFQYKNKYRNILGITLVFALAQEE
jgi:hypothetical protein